MNKEIRLAITGAAGQIGYALLFRLASGHVFGQDVTVHLNLLEIEPALKALEGVVMELNDCAFPNLGDITITSDANVAMKGANYAILVGAMPRKAGMERGDLLKMNGQIFSPQGKAINDHAADDIKVLVVGNPCNTNCLITMNHAPDVPQDRFFAMTMLDQNRACAQLAEKANVSINDVDNMIIWGNHSATQYPDYFNATIKDQPARDVINDDFWFENTFISTVQKRGAAIINARGLSSAASAANGIIDSISNLHFDKNEELYSMACASRGEYGVDEGLIFSFPCMTVNGKIKVLEGVSHNDLAKEKLQITLEELRREKELVSKLELIC